MDLTMGMIEENLPPEWVARSQYNFSDKGSIRNISFWVSGQPVSDEYVYLLIAQDIPEEQVGTWKGAFVVIGCDSRLFLNDNLEVICLRETVTYQEVHRRICLIFQKYNDWERKLFRMLLKRETLEKLGFLLYELIHEPIMITNGGHAIILNIYDHDNPESRKYYGMYQDPEWAYEELNLMYHNADYQKLYKDNRETFIFPAGIYKYRYLCRNFLEHEKRIGTIIIGEDYRPFQNADFVIIRYLTNVLKSAIFLDDNIKFPFSYIFEQMIQELLFNGTPFVSKYERILLEKKWYRRQNYMVIVLKPNPLGKASEQLLYQQLLLGDTFRQPYITLKDNLFIVILNLDIEGENILQALKKLERHIELSLYQGCASPVFTDFSEIKKRYLQVIAVFDYSLVGERELFCHYEEKITSLIREICLEKYPFDFFCTKGIEDLLEFDHKNNGCLFETLKKYVANEFNAAQTSKDLFIHLSTFKYRLGKIEKITGLSLNDEKNRRYLYFLMELLKGE